MLISGSSRTPNESEGGEQIMYSMAEDDHHHAGVSSQPNSSSSSSAAAASLFCSLSVLKEKVHQIHSLVSILLSPHDQTHPESTTTSIAIASMSNVIQELIVTASSMMFTCQQMSLIGSFSGTETLGWFGGNCTTPPPPPNINTCNMKENNNTTSFSHGSNNISVINRVEVERKAPIPVHHHHHHQHVEGDSKQVLGLKKNYDIIELDAADLLAKYTHYCQVCGKGFKRDANLRMHMRAHGDEYKTSAALSNPMKKYSSGSDAALMDHLGVKLPRKLYSCPQEGCRWNQRHAKFQPLKSMICVKNHYKRCHCPKMYVCKRCNRKNFSVLSDLRTHEKHCGDLKWQCSCGTTFSRKDKLMAHVVLFTGHSPITKLPAKVDNHSLPSITDSCNYIVAR